MSSAAEYRQMSSEQLNFALEEARKDLWKLRVQSATEKLDAPSRLKELRRSIARIHTIQRQRTAPAS